MGYKASAIPDSLGIKVTRAAADVLNGGTVNLFNVVGGKVAIMAIVGTVSVAAVDAAPSATKFSINPTVGTANDLCATSDVNGKEVGTMIGVVGNEASAMVMNSGSVRTSVSPICTASAGTIDIVSAADVGTGGALVDFILIYKPIDDGAYVEAI